MKIKLFLFCVIVLSQTVSYAQRPVDVQAHSDSLYNILKTSKNDSIKAQVNLQLISYTVNEDTALARRYLETGKNLSRNYPFLKAVSYYAEGFFYFNIDALKSEKAYLKSDSLLQKFKSKEAYVQRSNLWNNIAILKQRNDDDELHINIMLHKAIPLAQKAGDSALLGSQYNSVGIGFMNIKQYDKAEEYFEKSISYLKNLKGQEFRLISVYNRMSENYLLLNKLDQARKILDVTQQLLNNYQTSDYHSIYYMTEGIYSQMTHRYENALRHYETAIQHASGINKEYVIREIKFNKAKTLVRAKKYPEAQTLLNEMLSDTKNIDFDGDRVELYRLLALTSSGMGNMQEAYSWQLKYSELNDSLHNSELRDNINKMEARFQNVEKEKKIRELEIENQLSDLKRKNSSLFNWLLAGICLLLGSVLGFFYTNHRKNKKISAEKETNFKFQIKEMEHQKQFASAKSLIEGEERERKRMARDLHDGLGGRLAAIKMNLSKISINTCMINSDEINDVMNQVDNSLRELRGIAQNLMPETLLRSGLEKAISELCVIYENDKTKIEFQAFNIEVSIPENSQMMIYRIVQELLGNAIRHAEATEIILQCSQNQNLFFITVEDNGVGFDVNSEKEGFGLNNIFDRVTTMNGKMDVESVLGEGTTITVELDVSR